MNAAFVSDVLAIEGVEGTNLKVVRQEFGGQVSAHVRCDISSGAVLNLRPGAFKPMEGAPLNGVVVDKSADVGTLTAGRRYLETVVAEAGDVDITKQAVLVSVGRGIQEKDNIAIAEELADTLGRGGELLQASSRCQVAAEVAPSRVIRANGQAQDLHGMRHQRLVPTSGRH